MEQFGVSRPTLREAFRILEAESLIGVRRGSRGGAQVLEPDPSIAARHVGLLLQLQCATLKDVYAALLETDPLSARLLSRSRTQQQYANPSETMNNVTPTPQAHPAPLPTAPPRPTPP